MGASSGKRNLFANQPFSLQSSNSQGFMPNLINEKGLIGNSMQDMNYRKNQK
jgi:hypothetical protein